MITAPGHGILGDLVTECDTKIINIQDGFAVFSDEIKLALNPMIGVIGVSPLKSVPSTTPGDHGGNMDVKDIEIGSKVYFPVYIEGAGVAIGDLHACMADGEISGSGIEVSGRVKLRVSVTQRFNISTPFVETKSKFMIISSEKTLKAAIRKGVALVCEMIQRSLKIGFKDAYRLVSISCDVGICQIVNPMVTVKICIPKPLLKQAMK